MTLPPNNDAGQVIGFLEQNFLLENGDHIRFEPWQKANVLAPVVERVMRGCLDTFLIGLAKKNGKSTLSAALIAYAMLLDDPTPEVYSAAGDLDQARIIFASVEKGLKRSKLAGYFRFYRDVIERADGAGIYRAIASDASGIHGRNPTMVSWDELWNQPNYDLWEALTLSPARAHPFTLVTTYCGYQARIGNLLWDLYQVGMAGTDPRMYTYWLDGDRANPASWITPEYLERQRSRLPDHIFRRLHLNQWSVAQDAKAFRIPADVWQGAFEEFQPGAAYVVGIDLAKYRDFTAWCVLRTDVQPYRVVDIGKLPHCDYTIQVDLLDAKMKRFGSPKALIDVGAAGTAVIELMRGRGWSCVEFRFTNESKAKLVTDLAMAFEQRAVLLPKEGRTLDESRAIADLEVELFNFEPTILKSGNVRYEAGGAYHDDLVIALALAYSKRRAPHKPWIICMDGNEDAREAAWRARQ